MLNKIENHRPVMLMLEKIIVAVRTSIYGELMGWQAWCQMLCVEQLVEILQKP